MKQKSELQSKKQLTFSVLYFTKTYTFLTNEFVNINQDGNNVSDDSLILHTTST